MIRSHAQPRPVLRLCSNETAFRSAERGGLGMENSPFGTPGSGTNGVKMEAR